MFKKRIKSISIIAAIKEKIQPLIVKIKSKSFKSLYQEYKRKLFEYVKEVRYKINNLAKTNFDLALYHFNNGNIDDAIFRFNILNKFLKKNKQKRFLESYYYLGYCYIEKLKYSQAKNYINTYLQSGDDNKREEALYFLNVIKNNINDIKTIPLSIIKRNFDSIANKFNLAFFINRENPPQKILFDSLYQSLKAQDQERNNRILDLGCGTGLLGNLCQQNKINSYMVGVDISDNMLAFANNLNCYDQLKNSDIMNFLNNSLQDTKKNRYDIIILSNIITYIGDHFNLFSQINKIASDKAIIALSFRLLQQDEVMNLVEQGSENFSFIRAVQQFWYDANYLENLLQENGWFIWQKEPIKFVTNENGMIIIASKQKINNSFDSTLINEINSNETNNIDQDEEKSNKVISS